MLKRFSEISMRDVTTCGGKGASLGEMMSAGLPIPNGFVLTTNAYGKDSTEREKNVLQAFDELDTKFVAVRSSGTKEDGVDDSFAGQFDTYLFVTRENLIEKIKECHDSVNSERIISYCDYKGIDRKSIKVAVVIQKMVNSDSAGVCFTVNPVSQNHDEIMIDAGFGVGEAVVSGMITPDNYIVNKKTGEIKKNISQQEKKLVLSDKGGTQELEVIRDEQGKQKLSDENITKLSELAVKIEDHYGKPMDTERAVENGELYMLQARPITTLGIKNKKEDSVVDHFLQNLKQEDIFAFRGKMSLIEIGVSRTDKFLIVQKGEELIQLISYGEIIERVNKEFEDYWNNKNSISNIKNKIEKVFKDIDTFREEFLTNDLSKITDEEIQKLAQNAYNLYTSLVYSTAQYDIFGRDTMLYCMNKGFFSIDEKTFILASKPREISFEHRWNRVLIKYLSEGIDNVSNIEYIFTNYWNTKSEKEIKDYLKTVSIEKLKNVEDEYDKELSKNNSEIDDWYNKQSDDVKKVADFGMVISGLKDMRKDYIGKMGSIIYHLDKEMCRRANIDKRGWAFISPKELCLGIIGLKNIKSDIEKRIDDGVVCFGGYNLDWIIEPCNYDSIINEIERKIPGLSHDDTNIIHGQIGSVGKGIVRGFVKVVLSPDNADFKKGDILVTSMTRPEFLPLMKNAKAVITNEGGITCHAAIVSRELGIPCIIGTKNATQILKDGDLVEVDADNGIVKILDSISTGGETKNIQTISCDKENLVDDFISSLTHKENLLPPITTSSIFVQGSIELYAKHMPDYVKDNASMNGLTIYRGGETYTYVDSTKIINIANTVVQLFFSKKLTQEDIFRRFNQYTDQIDRSYKLYTHNYLKNLSNEKLFDLAKGLINSFMEFDATSLFAIVIDEKFLQNHSSIIKGLNNLPKDFYKNASNIPVISFDKQQKKDVIDCLENGGFNKENLEKLQYLGTSYSRYLSVEKMKKFILGNYQTDNLSIEKDMIDKEDENLEKAKTTYNKWYNSLTYQQQLIASFIYTSINLRDKRKNFTLKALCTISRIMEVFFVKNGLNKKYLWNIGFGEILEGPEYIISLKKRLGLREKGSVFFSDYNNQKLLIQEGTECFEVAFKKMKSLYNTDISNKIIQGFSGSSGKVQGTVKIVQFLDKNKNFKKGDILVTGMTRPEFVPLMKKASAIVTDEGGITCHAAIVSRELGIPCVIGTKIATQVLKDGDLVEVDADNGIVRIL